MSNSALIPWTPTEAVPLPTENVEPDQLITYASQLSERDRLQVAQALKAGSYEMATNYIWQKAIAALQRRIASLGMDFVGEMLGRPDITAHSQIEASVTVAELVSLCEDLGIFSSTDALRIRHTNELVIHFARLSAPSAENEIMRLDEAVTCIRNAIAAILGQTEVEVPEHFLAFRDSLTSKSYAAGDAIILLLRESPPFFKRATISILLSRLNVSTGAAAEHARRNVESIVPALWPDLNEMLRWQIGQAYAKLQNEGASKRAEARALSTALMAVQGFDYVPENLRSSTYAQAAKQIMEVHFSWNNFHNEGSAVRQLLALGTSIPMPAFPSVMTALVSIYLGNPYGYAFAAESYVQQVFGQLGARQWEYFVAQILPYDRTVLAKLEDYKPRQRFILLVKNYSLLNSVKEPKSLSGTLISAAHSSNDSAIKALAKTAYNAVTGSRP